MPGGTPFSVKDILNLHLEENSNFGYENSLSFDDDQNYHAYDQSASNLPNLGDLFVAPTHCQFSDPYTTSEYDAKNMNQWDDSTRVTSTNQSAESGMTSQHVQQLSHLSPPFQEVSSSDDSKPTN